MGGWGHTQFSQDVNRIGSIPAKIQGPIWGTGALFWRIKSWKYAEIFPNSIILAIQMAPTENTLSYCILQVLRPKRFEELIEFKADLENKELSSPTRMPSLGIS